MLYDVVLTWMRVGKVIPVAWTFSVNIPSTFDLYKLVIYKYNLHLQLHLKPNKEKFDLFIIDACLT